MISLLKEKKYFVCCDSLIQLGLMSERVLIVIEDWMLDAIDWLDDKWLNVYMLTTSGFFNIVLGLPYRSFGSVFFEYWRFLLKVLSKIVRRYFRWIVLKRAGGRNPYDNDLEFIENYLRYDSALFFFYCIVLMVLVYACLFLWRPTNLVYRFQKETFLSQFLLREFLWPTEIKEEQIVGFETRVLYYIRKTTPMVGSKLLSIYVSCVKLLFKLIKLIKGSTILQMEDIFVKNHFVFHKYLELSESDYEEATMVAEEYEEENEYGMEIFNIDLPDGWDYFTPNRLFGYAFELEPDRLLTECKPLSYDLSLVYYNPTQVYSYLYSHAFIYPGSLVWNEQSVEYKWFLNVSKMNYKYIETGEGLHLYMGRWTDIPSPYHHRYIYYKVLLYDLLIDSDSF